MSKAWQQGRFDGLCSIYSVINSVSYLDRTFSEDECSALFEFMIKAGGDLFPAAIYEGMLHSKLWGIAEQVQTHLAERVPLEFSRPFLRKQVDSVDEFCDILSKHLKSDAVALVGLGSPWDHWTVITRVAPRSVMFHDSYGIKRMNKSSLSLENRPKTTRIDYHQTIIISRL